MHILDERIGKLDDKTKTLIVVGYPPIGAYKLYNPNTQKVLISIDMIVDRVPCFLEENNTTTRGNVPTELPVLRRSQRARFQSSRLEGHELFSDKIVDDSGELVHFSFLVDSEQVDWKHAIDIREW